ncbi:MAG: AbfB domain-containing protein [Gluconacetobacter diazotrophicus]|nr:AbfB domain-containing protein [Gluconacetobacter diazotrophicus]
MRSADTASPHGRGWLNRFRTLATALRRRPTVFAAATVAATLAAGLATAAPARADTTLLPCDIYGAANTPCVAAHSTTRALYVSYAGPLYQIARQSDGKTRNISPLTTGGYANAAAQDSFCKDTLCTITRIYDQSPLHNDLAIQGRGGNGGPDVGAPADALPVTAGGHQVYGVSFSGQMGYRNYNAKGVARNGQPEGMYMVTSGTHVNDQCCFDYGNAETSGNDTGNGHMDAINFGTECWFQPCVGTGPWLAADLENGLFMSSAGPSQNSTDRSMRSPFVTALLKNNGQNYFALKAGNAQSGPLATQYAGPEPTAGGYSPMQLEGSIVLGTGGDNSNGSVGNFFEGVMTMGLPSDAADDQVQANIVSVNYGGPTGIVGTLKPGSEISFETQAPCCDSFFIAHDGYNSNTTSINAISTASSSDELGNATWIVRRGFADTSCLSFESRNRPGEFLRHFNFKLQRGFYDGSIQFADDATFCQGKGNTGKGKSFTSVNFPTKFFRTYNYGVYVAGDGGSNAWDTTIGFPKDSSWTITAPLAP